MSSAKLVTAALALALLSGVADFARVHASHPEAQACVFDKYTPISAAPYMSENSVDFGSYTFLGGAQLFVPAREGLTKEWLAASVQDALASAHLTANDGSSGGKRAICNSPRVRDVHVRVVSAGNGFWVQLIGQDTTSSELLLKWARSIVEQRKPLQKVAR